MFRQHLSILRCPATSSSSSKWASSCLPQVTPRSLLLAAGSSNFIAPEQNQIQSSKNTNGANGSNDGSTIINPFKGVRVEKSKFQLVEEIATKESVSFYSFTQQLPAPNASVDTIQDVTALLHSMNISQHILDRNLRFQNHATKASTRNNDDNNKNNKNNNSNDDEGKKAVTEESNKSSNASVVEEIFSSQELIGSLLPFSSFKGLVSFCNQSEAASRDILLQCGAIGVLRDFIFRANKFLISENNSNNNNNNRDDSKHNNKHKNKNRNNANNNNENNNKKFASLRQEVVQVKNWMHQLVSNVHRRLSQQQQPNQTQKTENANLDEKNNENDKLPENIMNSNNSNNNNNRNAVSWAELTAIFRLLYLCPNEVLLQPIATQAVRKAMRLLSPSTSTTTSKNQDNNNEIMNDKNNNNTHAENNVPPLELVNLVIRDLAKFWDPVLTLSILSSWAQAVHDSFEKLSLEATEKFDHIINKMNNDNNNNSSTNSVSSPIPAGKSRNEILQQLMQESQELRSLLTVTPLTVDSSVMEPLFTPIEVYTTVCRFLKNGKSLDDYIVKSRTNKNVQALQNLKEKLHDNRSLAYNLLSRRDLAISPVKKSLTSSSSSSSSSQSEIDDSFIISQVRLMTYGFVLVRNFKTYEQITVSTLEKKKRKLEELLARENDTLTTNTRNPEEENKANKVVNDGNNNNNQRAEEEERQVEEQVVGDILPSENKASSTINTPPSTQDVDDQLLQNNIIGSTPTTNFDGPSAVHNNQRNSNSNNKRKIENRDEDFIDKSFLEKARQQVEISLKHNDDIHQICERNAKELVREVVDVEFPNYLQKMAEELSSAAKSEEMTGEGGGDHKNHLIVKNVSTLLTLISFMSNDAVRQSTVGNEKVEKFSKNCWKALIDQLEALLLLQGEKNIPVILKGTNFPYAALIEKLHEIIRHDFQTISASRKRKQIAAEDLDESNGNDNEEINNDDGNNNSEAKQPDLSDSSPENISGRADNNNNIEANEDSSATEEKEINGDDDDDEGDAADEAKMTLGQKKETRPTNPVAISTSETPTLLETDQDQERVLRIVSKLACRIQKEREEILKLKQQKQQEIQQNKLQEQSSTAEVASVSNNEVTPDSALTSSSSSTTAQNQQFAPVSRSSLLQLTMILHMFQSFTPEKMSINNNNNNNNNSINGEVISVFISETMIKTAQSPKSLPSSLVELTELFTLFMTDFGGCSKRNTAEVLSKSVDHTVAHISNLVNAGAKNMQANQSTIKLNSAPYLSSLRYMIANLEKISARHNNLIDTPKNGGGQDQHQQELLFSLPPVEILQRLNSFFSAVVPNLPQKFTSPATQQLMIRVAVLLEKLGTRSDVVAKQLLMLVAKRNKTASQQQNSNDNNNLADLRLIQTAATISTPNAHPLIAASFILLCKNIPGLFEAVNSKDTSNKMQDKKMTSSSSVVPELDSNTTTTSEALNVGVISNEAREDGEVMNNTGDDDDDEGVTDVQVADKMPSKNLPSPQLVARIYTIAHKCGASQIVEKLVETELFSRTTPASENNKAIANDEDDGDDDSRTEKNLFSNKKAALQWAVRISLFCDAAAAPKELRDLARMKLASNDFFGEIYPALEMIQKVLPIMTSSSSSSPSSQSTSEGDADDSLMILSTLWNLHGIKNLYRLGTLIVSSEEELKLARTEKQQKLELIVNTNNNNKSSQITQQQQQQQHEANSNINDEDNAVSDDETKNKEAVLIETSQNLMNSFKTTLKKIQKNSLLTKLFVSISVATLQETLRLHSSMMFDAPVFKQVQIAKLLNALISLDALERQNHLYLKRESLRLSKELNALRDELLDEEEKEVAAPPKGGETETASINGHHNNNNGDKNGNNNNNNSSNATSLHDDNINTADDDAAEIIANFIANELQSEKFTSSSLLSESMVSTIVSMFRSISHDNQGEVLLRCCAASLSQEEIQILGNNLPSSQQQQQLAVTLLLECGGETAGKIPLPAAIGLLNVEKNRNTSSNSNNNSNLPSSSSSSASSKIERTVRERLETEIIPLDVMIPLLVRGSGGHSKEILDLVLDAHFKFVESDQQDEMQFEQVMKLLSATCSSKNNILSQRHFEWLVKLLKKLLSTDATTNSKASNGGNQQALTAEQREFNAIFGSGNETSENNIKNTQQEEEEKEGRIQQPTTSSIATSSNALVTNMDATDRTSALLTLNNLSNRLSADDKENLTCLLLGFYRGKVQSVSELVSFIQSQQRELSTGPVAAFIVTEAKRMCFTETASVVSSVGEATATTTASAVRLNRELISALARADLLSQSFLEEQCLAKLVYEIEKNKKQEKITTSTSSSSSSSSDLLFLLRSAAERKILDRSVLTSLVTLVQENPLEFDPHELIDFIELQLSTNFKSGSKVANEIFGPICNSIQQVFIAKGVRNFLPTETGKLLKTVSTIQRCLTASNNHSHSNFGKTGDQMQQENAFLQLRPEIQDHLHHHCSRIVHAVEPAMLAGMLRVIISDPQLSQSKTFDLLAARVERICPVLSPEDWQPIASAFIHSNNFNNNNNINNSTSSSSSKMETLIDLICLQYLRFAESSSAASTNKRVIGQCHLTVLELLAKFSINDIELVRVATEAIRQMGLSNSFSNSSSTLTASSGVLQQQQQSTNNMTFPTYDSSRLVNLLESLSQVFVDEKHPADDIIFSAVAQIEHAKGAAPWVLVRTLKAACELGVPYHRSINSLFMRAHDSRQAILGSPELADIMRNVCYEYDKNVGVHISVAFTSRKRAQ